MAGKKKALKKTGTNGRPRAAHESPVQQAEEPEAKGMEKKMQLKANETEKAAQATKGKATEQAKAAAKKEGRATTYIKKIYINKNYSLLALVGIAIIVGYLAVSSMLKPVGEIGLGDLHGQTDAEDKYVRFFLIYNGKECNECELGNSFIGLLQKNGIKFGGQKYQSDSEEGKRFIEELGLKKIPAILVDGESISDEMIVRGDGQLQLTTEQGAVSTISLENLMNVLTQSYPKEAFYDSQSNIFVLYELGLDGKRHIDYLIGTEACEPENPQHLARVDLFIDPYSIPYINSSSAVNFYRDYYKGRMEFNYHYLPIEASTKFHPEIPWGNIENIGRYLVCMEEQGILLETESAFYASYCSLDGDETLQPNERSDCADSNHFGYPILGDEADEIAKSRLEYDEAQFAECLGRVSARFAEDTELAEKFSVYRVPTVVVNCKYATHTINLDQALCKLNPEMEHCPFFG